MTAAAAAASLRQTRITILLSLNAVAILVAGVVIASAIGLTGDGQVHVVAEYTDILDGSADVLDLMEAGLLAVDGENVDLGPGQVVITPVGAGETTDAGEVTNEQGKATGGKVNAGELWNENSMTIYQSADKDICIDDSLPGYANMYWQTSNKDVIAGFYGSARSYLGYSSDKCRYPVIKGTGTTTVTVGTYDGSRRDSIEVTVLSVPVEQWKKDVLALVNKERAAKGLSALAWGGSCASAADVRAKELISRYSHTRPNGEDWSSLCAVPAANKGGGAAGENVAAGASSVSPVTVVSAWMASESHRKNILDSRYKYLTVGFVFDPSTQYKTFWSQIFTSF